MCEDSKISEIFNEYFGNVVGNMNITPFESDCAQINSDDPIVILIAKYQDHPSILKIKEKIPNDLSFSFCPVDINGVMDEIANLNVSISVPIASIPTKLIKENCDIFGQKILIDFNSSIKTGIFPLNQNLADVSPIYKKTNAHHKENYRPVSILYPRDPKSLKRSCSAR